VRALGRVLYISGWGRQLGEELNLLDPTLPLGHGGDELLQDDKGREKIRRATVPVGSRSREVASLGVGVWDDDDDISVVSNAEETNWRQQSDVEG
jgi:hypothetical protein